MTKGATKTNVTQDLSLNLKWSINERMRANFDVQYVESTVRAWDVETGFASFADIKVDLRDRAAVEWLAPTNVNFSEGNWSNPNNWRMHHIMDHFQDSEGDEFAARADFEYDFHINHLESIKIGFRYADRDQQVRASNYNWESVATSWSGNQAHYYNLDHHEPGPVEIDEESGEEIPIGTNGNQKYFTGYPQGYYEVQEFGDDYFDLGIGNGQLPFANMDLLKDRWAMINSLGGPALGFEGGVGWEPACSGLGDRADELNSDLCVTPAELVDVSEETSAAYIQFNIGGNDSTLFGLPYSGNVGVRYVYTNVQSKGGWAITSFADEEWVSETSGYESQVGRDVDGIDRDLVCEDRLDPEGNPESGVPKTLGCYISDDDARFFEGEDQVTESDINQYHILPSLNLKLDFTDELVGRLGLNRAMSRPDMGYLRNFYRLSPEVPYVTSESDPAWIRDESGEVVGVNVYARGSGQNSGLKPITADQIDLTLEWYFDDDGSLTGALFHKDLDNYIQHVRFDTEVESNGVTKEAVIRAPVNGDGAEIQGFELAFTDFFDSLPVDGFGIKANYTYVDNQGLKTSYTSSSDSDGVFENTLAASNVEVDALRGLSEHTANFIAMYEVDSWSARLAYNWRSEFLITPIDSVIGRPMWQDDFSTLDGSVKFRPMDGLTISLKASNLLNEEVVLKQQVTNATGESGIVNVPNDTRLAGSWFQKGRRFTLSASYKF